MVLSGTVKLSASRRSPEVLVYSAASPCIAPLSRVTRLAPGAGGSRDPSKPSRQKILFALVQETEQQKKLYYNHCGMARCEKIRARKGR